MAGKFEIYKDKGGEFRFRLVAGNGENLLSSEGYKAKASAENGVESIKKNAPIDQRYDLRESSSGKPYFVLRAGNHEVIGSSQMYSSAQARAGGVDAVKRAVVDAKVEDLT